MKNTNLWTLLCLLAFTLSFTACTEEGEAEKEEEKEETIEQKFIIDETAISLEDAYAYYKENDDVFLNDNNARVSARENTHRHSYFNISDADLNECWPGSENNIILAVALFTPVSDDNIEGSYNIKVRYSLSSSSDIYAGSDEKVGWIYIGYEGLDSEPYAEGTIEVSGTLPNLSFTYDLTQSSSGTPKVYSGFYEGTFTLEECLVE